MVFSPVQKENGHLFKKIEYHKYPKKQYKGEHFVVKKLNR